MHAATAWPPADAVPSTFFLDDAHSGRVNSLNDGSLTEEQPTRSWGQTSWTYPDPKWMAGVTTFDKNGIPDHFARVITFTTKPFDRDREFTGQGVLILYASSDQTDMDIAAKLSLFPLGSDKPPFIKVST